MNDLTTVQTSIYSALRTAPATYAVYDAVPQGVSKPYIVIGEVTAEPDEELQTWTTDAAINIHTWSATTSKGQSYTMLQFIRARLDNRTISGAWYCSEDFNEVMEDEGSTAAARLYHGVARYRVRVSEDSVSLPSGFSYAPRILPYSPAPGYYAALADVESLAPVTTATRYVGYPGAIDTTGSSYGLSADKSWASISYAIANAPNNSTIQIAAGTMYRPLATWGSAVTGKTFKFVGDGVGATFSCSDILTWTVHSGTTYKATRSSVLSVWDSAILGSDGDYTQLVNAVDLTTCIATSGTWWTDNVTVYVHTADNRVVDATIRAYINVTFCAFVGPGTIYFENLRFEGDTVQVSNGGSGASTCLFLAKNCKFKYAPNSNGLTILGCDSVVQGCEASHNWLDGFNYHWLNSVLCHSVEISCIGRDSGGGGLHTYQGSTTHDGNSVMRINGEYYRCEGPCIADVGVGSQSWNLGVYCHDSACTIADTRDAGFYDSDMTMWLDGCRSVGNFYDLVKTGANGALNKRAFTPAVPVTSGTAVDY